MSSVIALVAFAAFLIAAAVGANAGAGPAVMTGLLAFFGGCLYLAPTLVALHRKHANVAPIVALNLLLGWVVVPWVAALIWAFSRNEAAEMLKLQRTAVQPVEGKPASPESSTPASHQQAAVVVQLERLQALRSSGALTEAEYTAAKHRLLGL